MSTLEWSASDGIGVLTLNRPSARNALSMELMSEMSQHLKCVKDDKSVRVILITHNGPVFSSGHDLKEMAAATGNRQKYQQIFSLCSELMIQVTQLPQAVVAQVGGIATAAGCQLVAACDVAIASTQAKFATPGVNIGLFCSTPSVPLVRAVGRKVPSPHVQS